MNEELKSFIDKARKKGISDSEIKNKLLKNGWEANLVDSELKGNSKNGFAIASLIIGIITIPLEILIMIGLFGLVFIGIPLTIPIFIVLSPLIVLPVIGLVLGIVGLKKKTKRGFCMTGIVLNSISILILLIGIPYTIHQTNIMIQKFSEEFLKL